MKYKVGKKPEDIRQRAFKFSLRVISMCRVLPKDDITKVLVRQIIRSATSVGANLEEAIGSRTKAEFTNCTNIAKKEARETLYWLKILYEIVNSKTKIRMEELLQEANEIVSILTSSIKKLDKRKSEKYILQTS